MANANVNQFGQLNGAGDAKANFLKVFSGEVLTAFETANVTLDRHTIRTISSGKSASFPATWKVKAGYHTPGAELVGQKSNVGERIINIDDILVADIFLDDLDQAMTHFEVRAEYSKQAGIVLANTWDANVFRTGILAARASATVTGGVGGSSLTSATTLYRTSATDLAAGIYSAIQAMDEKDIPETDEKFTYVKPAQYYLLAQSKDILNRDWGGSGSYSDGKVLRIAGSPIVKTNQLPVTDTTGVPEVLAKYQGDFSKTAALVMTKAAVGTVKLMDLATRIDYDPRRLGDLIVAKYAIGTGILRPECSVELKTTT